jgi:hypothetical protein
MVWGGQGYRAVRGEDVADFHLLGHRTSGDLQGISSHDDVAASGCRWDRLELRGDRAFDHLPDLLGRGSRLGRAGFRSRAHLGSEGHERDPETLDPVAEVRGRAHAGFLTKVSQLHR